MKDYQREFIEFCLENNVLKFGVFKLKSGRTSPYFFNAGLFNSGKALASLGEFYADAFVDSPELASKIDLLFGPAYKGIPLVSVLASTLYSKHKRNFPYAFNRKEAKDHGEGGVFVGSTVTGNVLVVDDVITAGTAIRETVGLLSSCTDARLSGVLIALDRKEKGPNGVSAIEQVKHEYGVPVVSIVTLYDILEYLKEKGGYEQQIASIEEYQREFGLLNVQM